MCIVFETNDDEEAKIVIVIMIMIMIVIVIVIVIVVVVVIVVIVVENRARMLLILNSWVIVELSEESLDILFRYSKDFPQVILLSIYLYFNKREWYDTMHYYVLKMNGN